MAEKEKRTGRLDLRKTFFNLQSQMISRLYTHRETVTHPGTKGDVTEANWINLFNDYLPERYRTAKAFVLDSDGRYSNQIDLVVFDRQYSPFLFNQDGALYIPAESVYAIFEIKQYLDQESLLQALERIKSVRRLKRTTAPIPHAGGTYPAKKPFKILAGFLGLYSTWEEPFGNRFQTLMDEVEKDLQLDLACILEKGSFEGVYGEKESPVFETAVGGKALIFFFLRLLRRLQQLGTAPAMDLGAYEECLNRREE